MTSWRMEEISHRYRKEKNCNVSQLQNLHPIGLGTAQGWYLEQRDISKPVVEAPRGQILWLFS